MNKTIYYLSTCKTCQRILTELGVDDTWTQREIKSSGITKEEVEQMHKLKGSYEALFSRRSMKYRAWNLAEKELAEDDYKKYIIEEYTFLKRPVVILDDQIFVGNAKKEVEGAKAVLEGE